MVPTNTKFLDNYVDSTPFTGRVFNSNASKVHSYIALLISENSVAEQKLLPNKDGADRLVDYFPLQEFYEGVGANSKAGLTSNNKIQDIFYRGENPPDMRWEKFEVKLNNTFSVIG